MCDETRSYWNATAEKDAYSPLDRSMETDILIIGGGITGITCAYCLAENGLRPVLIEAGKLCDGTTGNTTGKVTIQHGIIYSNIIHKHGKEFAKKYAESQTSALDFVRKQVQALSIDCQLETSDSYLFAQTEAEKAQVLLEYEISKEIGIDCELIEKADFPPDNFGMLRFKNQAVFHPVRYCNALASAAMSKGAQIYCSTKAIKVINEDAITVVCENDIEIKTKHLVMATQYPIYDGPNLFFTRLYAKRAYGIAVDTRTNLPDGNYINVGDPTRSIRTHVEGGKQILIIVGENHSPGRGEENTKLHYERLIGYAGQIADVNAVLARWSAQDYDTPDQIPYIGRISGHSTIYVASGFGKWGLSNGTLAGTMISALIKDGHCRFEDLYSRSRRDYASSIGKTIIEVLTPVGELLKSKLEGEDSPHGIKPGEGRVIRYHGQKAGIYRDDQDNITILDISCTHMSTELNFNPAEKTWDCPAHGGRYNTDGKLLEGPPKHSLKVLFRGKYSDIEIRENSKDE